MYPWQNFAIQPDFSDKIALRTTQSDALTWIELTTKINQTVAFLQKKRRKCGKCGCFCGKKFRENFIFISGDNSAWRKSFRHQSCFSTRKKLQNYVSFIKLIFVFMIKIC